MSANKLEPAPESINRIMVIVGRFLFLSWTLNEEEIYKALQKQKNKQSLKRFI
ncbi:MAG: hypothetical protein IPH52_13165 [Leptospiraceae bacterium]|nr:hypothetical protein [Leptospiraceae bacterium]